MSETIKVPDMMCESCASAIAKALDQVGGVEHVEFDIPGKLVKVDGEADRDKLVSAIKSAGYKPEAVGSRQ